MSFRLESAASVPFCVWKSGSVESVRLFLLFCLLTFSKWSAAAENEAFVTFYSSGSVIKSGVPRTKHNFFMGMLFDGQQRLGNTRLHRFMTMRFPAGEHVFSASSDWKRPDGKAQLTLTLEEGKHYIIRAEAEPKGVYIVYSDKNKLDVVPCEAAHDELQKATAVEEKYVPKDVRDRLVQDKALLECH